MANKRASFVLSRIAYSSFREACEFHIYDRWRGKHKLSHSSFVKKIKLRNELQWSVNNNSTISSDDIFALVRNNENIKMYRNRKEKAFASGFTRLLRWMWDEVKKIIIIWKDLLCSEFPSSISNKNIIWDVSKKPQQPQHNNQRWEGNRKISIS